MAFADVAQADRIQGNDPITPQKDSLLKLLITPLVLVLIVVTVFVAKSLWNLDSIEQRTLDNATLGQQTSQHIYLVAVSTVLVILIAIPLGVLVTRKFARFLSPPIILLANLGQAIPVIGVLVLIALWGIFPDLGPPVAITAIVIYGVLPVLRNTITGIQSVEPALVEAANGIGMTPWKVLTLVELPLAIPYILAGLRTTLVLNVGVATLGTFVNAGGLGDTITAGIKLQRPVALAVGAILTIVLALLIDWLGSLAERWLTPKGL